MYNIPVCRPLLPTLSAISPYLQRIDAARLYTNQGPLVELLERRLAAHFNVDHTNVACVSSATMGLMLALLACNVGIGSECNLPSWTFAASAHAILAAGLRPRIIDVEPSTGTLSPQWLDARSAADDAPVTLVVSLFGAPIDISSWTTWTEKRGRKVVIDAAGGFDTVVPSALPTVVSLHATKALTSAEGGFVICTDVCLMDRIREARNFGFSVTRSSQHAGFNGKMSEYHAAVGNVALDGWPLTREKFERVIRRYSSGLGIARQSWVSATAMFSLAGNVERAESELSKIHIETRRWWARGLHTHPAFLDYCNGLYPHTETQSNQHLGLPCYVDLQPQTIDKIVTTLERAL